jgi:hypothetical protein
MLAAVLVSSLIVMLLGAELTRVVAARCRQTRLSEQQLQSFWLAESGLQRALLRFAESPDYAGETWRVPADVLGGVQAGEVVIQVRPAADPEPARLIRIQAQFPEGAVHCSLSERELFVTLQAPPAAKSEEPNPRTSAP